LRLVLVAPLALPLLALSPAAPWRDGAPSLPVAGPAEAHAAVSVLMSLDELVSASSLVVVATATERESRWEYVAGGRRIVTYTKLKVDRGITGPGSKEVVVRTLGGSVGKIGQHVSGEAAISIGKPSLLFLAKVDETLVVTGLAQGHYPVVTDAKGVTRLTPSPDAGTLLPRRGPQIAARELLVGATLDEGTQAVERTRRALDGK
jgi:hypothetical protein